MSVININKQVGFLKNGSEVMITVGPTDDYDFTVKNEGPGIATGVKIEITVPSGLSIKAGQSSVNKGTFDDTTAVWDIGSLLLNDEVEGYIVFEVTDSCLMPYQIIFEATSDACDCNLTNNDVCINVEGVSCCEIMECTLEGLLYDTECLAVSNKGTADTVILTNLDPPDPNPNLQIYPPNVTPTGTAGDWIKQITGYYIGCKHCDGYSGTDMLKVSDISTTNPNNVVINNIGVDIGNQYYFIDFDYVLPGPYSFDIVFSCSGTPFFTLTVSGDVNEGINS